MLWNPRPTDHSSRTRFVASRLHLASRAGRLNSGVSPRMNFMRRVVRAELVTLGWLAVCAIAFASFAYFSDSKLSAEDGFNQALWLCALFFAVGFLPVLLYGAPAYTWLNQNGRARWWSALLVGMLPGVVILPLEPSIGAYALAAGGTVSLLTHLVIARWANNSFKPNPLRSSKAPSNSSSGSA